MTRELFDAWKLEVVTLRALHVQASKIFAVIAAKDVKAASSFVDRGVPAHESRDR